MRSKQCQSPKFEHFSEGLNDSDEEWNRRYLPVTRQEGFDLRAHIETAGHQVIWNELKHNSRSKGHTAYRVSFVKNKVNRGNKTILGVGPEN